MNEIKSKYKIQYHFSLGKSCGEIFVFEWVEQEIELQKNKTKFQREAIRYFLQNELNIGNEIIYNDEGAPFLKDSDLFISISHSTNLFALQISEIDFVGVDIQLIKKSLQKGYSYFVNKQEEQVHDLTVLNLHLIWSTKESVYKLKKGKVKKYREDINVLEITEKRIYAKHDKEKIKCCFLSGDNFVLVYVCRNY